ncbi:MAG TPA: beta-propeller fold lactonase family protein, partial [Acidimicrobiales bacterium]|nr:beta-propeller fold lactonase family protein [Acidimicrobiales bacterium]
MSCDPRPLLALLAVGALGSSAAAAPIPIPTSQFITPTATPGSTFQPLNPHLTQLPDFTAGQAVTSVVSPDNRTMLVLTSGYNLNLDSNGNNVAATSNEYVFVFDISKGAPVQTQVLEVPNTYVGLVFAPDGATFYVTGGVDDDVHRFQLEGGSWAESGAAIELNNGPGNGITKGIAPVPAVGFPGIPPFVGAQAAGVAVSADATTLAVANYENDSVSLVSVATGQVRAFDLRPGKSDPSKAGVPGGEFPYWLAFKGSDRLYVSSLRDREIVVLDVSGAAPAVVARIALKGNPTKMILNRAQTRLLAASDNSDTVDIIDTASNQLLGSIDTTSPGEVPKVRRGSSPNSLALSPDEKTLYVTNAGTNSIALIKLDDSQSGGRVEGLIPTGWYPNSVSVSTDGRTLYVVNAKSKTGPSPRQCTDVGPGPYQIDACPASLQNGSANEYVLQQTKAGLLTVPVPHGLSLAELTEV